MQLKLARTPIDFMQVCRRDTKILPWICVRCTREFPVSRLRELTDPLAAVGAIGPGPAAPALPSKASS